MTETLLAENEILRRRVAELEAERDKAITERDAAIKDIFVGVCESCTHFSEENNKLCLSCAYSRHHCEWEWRGTK